MVLPPTRRGRGVLFAIPALADDEKRYISRLIYATSHALVHCMRYANSRKRSTPDIKRKSSPQASKLIVRSRVNCAAYRASSPSW
jgi:hypothetical protein